MKRRNLRAKRHLSQNFLYDPAIARRIVEAGGVSEGDVVVELGAGRGILTRALAEAGARVIALEIDPRLLEALAEAFGAAGDGGSVEVLAADLTRVTLPGLLDERGVGRCRLFGNIPYHLTRDVLFSFLVEGHRRIAGAAIMVQREVGERIVSPPGSRVYGITSVILQTLYDVRIALRVAPGSFVPRPKVASVVLRFDPVPEPPLGDDALAGFTAVVKTLFQQRRKTVQNSLKAFCGLDDAGVARVCAEAGVDPGVRPETLAKEAFLALHGALVRADARTVPSRRE